MSRLGPAAVGLLVVALAAVVDSLDNVGLRIYAYNGTDADARLHVTVRGESGPLVDKTGNVRPNQSGFLVGTVHGPPGLYSWTVAFGNATAAGQAEWGDSDGPMSIILFPGDELEVGVDVA